MTAAPSHSQIVPQQSPPAPALRAADRGVADSLESVLADNTRRTYDTQWRMFDDWCTEVGLTSLPAEPLTVARYLAARAGSGASIATLRLATSAIAKAHEWAKLESPCLDPGVRASLKGWGRRLSKPQRQSGALTADVLAVIRLTAVQPRERGRGIETPAQASERGKFDLALVAVLSDAGLRRSEAAALTWGDVQRWDDGSGRITVVRSKTDAEAQGAVVAITPAAMGPFPPSGRQELQVKRKCSGCRSPRSPGGSRPSPGQRDWRTGSSSAATAAASAWPDAWPRTAPPPTRSNARAAGSRAAAWSAATPAARPPDQPCGTCSSGRPAHEMRVLAFRTIRRNRWNTAI